MFRNAPQGKQHEAIEMLWLNEDAEKDYWVPNKELYTRWKYEFWETQRHVKHTK